MKNRELYEKLLSKFSLSESSVDEHRNYYNSSFDSYDNDIYADNKTRFVHLLNFWEKDSWLNNRFNLVFGNYSKYDEIIDLGFGLPYLALRLNESGELEKLPKQIFVDSYQSAVDVSKEILNILNIEAEFILGNIESEEVFAQLKNRSKGEKKLIVSLETIEHLKSPEKFWENLKMFTGSDCIFSLPIGPEIPSHHSFFESEQDVRDYLSQYIDIEKENMSSPSKVSGKGSDEYKIMSVLGKIK